MPRAILMAVPLIIACYLFANISFFAVLQLDEMADFKTHQSIDGFVTLFGARAIGVAGQIAFPILIALSAYGALDGEAFVGSFE